MEKGLFKQGENRNIDILGLKVKKLKPKPIDGFPYVGIVGEKLKKGPKNWQDVSAQVVTDYQRHCENLFVERLRKKYKVEVDKDVLKTVNKH
jgi:peptidyl-prolyl cis-trans isomerase SurA